MQLLAAVNAVPVGLLVTQCQLAHSLCTLSAASVVFSILALWLPGCWPVAPAVAQSPPSPCVSHTADALAGCSRVMHPELYVFWLVLWALVFSLA